MFTYRVVLNAFQVEPYVCSHYIKADSADEAIAKAREVFDFDPSPYATGDYTWLESPAFVETIESEEWL